MYFEISPQNRIEMVLKRRPRDSSCGGEFLPFAVLERCPFAASAIFVYYNYFQEVLQ